MNFSFSFKDYTIFLLNGKWRFYSDDITIEKEEALEVLNYLNSLDVKDYCKIPEFLDYFYLRRKFRLVNK